MRFWISKPRMFGGLIRPVSFGPANFNRRRCRAVALVIVLEQHADPVELVSRHRDFDVLCESRL